jgi:hypothetical protein
VLVNPTSNEIEATVSFPLPEIDTQRYWLEVSDAPAGEWPAAIGRHGDDPLNFVGFEVSINGQTVPTEASQIARAWRKSGEAFRLMDVTGELKSAGVPVLLLHRSDLDRLSEDTRRKLFDAHLLETYDPGYHSVAGTYPKTYQPVWRVDTAFRWQQRFPAGGTTKLDVSYRPMTGGTLRPVRGSELLERPDPACFNDWRQSDLRSRKAVSSRTTRYILTTANAWNGSIGRFHLTIDKLKPENLLTVCADGRLKKTGPATYEFTAERFAPTRDIRLLVLETGAPVQ